MLFRSTWTVTEYNDTLYMEAKSELGDITLTMDLASNSKLFTLYWSVTTWLSDSIHVTKRGLDFASALLCAEQLLSGKEEYRLVWRKEA